MNVQLHQFLHLEMPDLTDLQEMIQMLPMEVITTIL